MVCASFSFINRSRFLLYFREMTNFQPESRRKQAKIEKYLRSNKLTKFGWMRDLRIEIRVPFFSIRREFLLLELSLALAQFDWMCYCAVILCARGLVNRCLLILYVYDFLCERYNSFFAVQPELSIRFNVSETLPRV